MEISKSKKEEEEKKFAVSPHVFFFFFFPEGELEGYKDIIRTFKHYFTWIALLNVDEFLVIHEHATGTRCFSNFLSNFSDFGGLVVPWAFFGNDRLVDRSVSSLVIESFQYRWKENTFIKSIVNPMRVDTMIDPHYASYRGSYYAVDVEKRKHSHRAHLLATDNPYGKIQLNHYWTKSYKEWLAKMLRGYGRFFPERHFWEFEAHTAEGLCSELDQTMHVHFLPTLQKLLD